MRSAVIPLLLLVGCSEYGVKQEQRGIGDATTSIPPTGSSTTDTGGFTWSTGTGGTGTGGTGTGGTGTATGGTATGGTSTGTATGTGGTGTGGTTSTGDLVGGHFDVDTTSYVSAIANGDTDAHVHEYDDQYLVSGIDAFVYHDAGLHEIFEDITDPDQRFKILAVNADLSPGGRVVINDVYAASNDRTWTDVTEYDDTAVSALPVYTLGGVTGTTELRELGLYFDTQAIITRELVPTVTGCVRDNVLGVDGSWRNGALTLQAVAVDANGVDAFTTDASMSSGDHPVATSGLLWETTIFWHWTGPCSDDPGWATYVP